MIHAPHLREMIREVLIETDYALYSEDAVELLMGTAAVETDFGFYLKQIPDGPGQGIFSIEPDTEDSIWNHHLKYRKPRASAVARVTGIAEPTPSALFRRFDYQIIMARLKYRTCPGALPDAGDIYDMAKYWNKFYNANPNFGTESEFVEKYCRYCLD